MRKLLFGLNFLLMYHSFADISDCFKDAHSNGNSLHAVAPSSHCGDLIKRNENKVEDISPTGDLKVYGLQNMFYVENKGRKELMAGDQTQLRNISFLHVNESARRVIVYQHHSNKSSISVFDTDFVGNVSPISYYASKDVNRISNIFLLEESKELVLMSIRERSVVFMNMLADSRLKGEKYLPVVKRFLQGEKTLLVSPLAVAHSSRNKEIYVLDHDRVLVFPENSQGDLAPLRILPATGRENCTHLMLNDAHDMLIFSDEEKRLPYLKIK